MKKHLTRLRAILLIIIAFAFVQCQDEYVETNLQSQLSDSKNRHTILTGTAARIKKNDLVKSLKTSGGMERLGRKMKHLRTLHDVEEYIDDAEVYQIKQKNSLVYYTYRINLPTANDTLFYNIVMKEEPESKKTKTVLIAYSMQSDYASDLVQNKVTLSTFTGVMHFEQLSIDDGFPCDEEPDVPVPVSGGSGNGSGNPGTGDTGSGTGGGAGSVNNGYTYSQNLVNMQYLSLSYQSSTGTDTNNDGVDDEEEEWYEVSRSPRNYFRTNSVNPVIADPDDPCGEDEEIGVLEPDDPEINCNTLTQQTAHQDIKDELNALKTIANNTSFNQEAGFYATKNAGDSYSAHQIPAQNILNPEQYATEGTITLPPGNNAVLMAHTHPCDYQGYLMFSPEDLYALYAIFRNWQQPAGETKGYYMATSILVTCQGTYAIKIDNIQNVHEYMQAYGESFKKDLEKKYWTREPMDPISFFEKDLLGFLNEKGLKISLYKADQNYNWSKLTLNDNGNTNDGDDIVATPCN